MSQRIVCIYTFNLNPGVTDEDFITASAKVDAVLLNTEGFVYRSLTRTESGLWQDIVYWDSQSSQEKSRLLEATSTFDGFVSLINNSSVNFHRAQLFSQVFPEMAAA